VGDAVHDHSAVPGMWWLPGNATSNLIVISFVHDRSACPGCRAFWGGGSEH
jgi:hypothetical protein